MVIPVWASVSTSSSGTAAFSKYPCPLALARCAEHVLGSRAPATNRVDTASGLVGTGVPGGGALDMHRTHVYVIGHED